MDNLIRMKNMSRRRFFKRAARKMLFSDWICQIFAFIVVGALFVGMSHFGTSVGVVVNELTQNLLFTLFTVYFFEFFALAFVIPLIYGLITFEINAVTNDKSVMSDIFCAFSDSSLLMRSYSLFFRVLLRSIFCFLPAIAVMTFREFYFEEGMFGVFVIGNIDVVSFLVNTLFVLFVYFGIVMSSGVTVGIFVTVKRHDLSIDDCFYMAKKCMKNSGFEIAKTALSFLPLFVVSLFTMGFLFVMYTFPYMLITFVMFAKYLYDKYNFELQVQFDENLSENISE